jgi:hypothetical protein
VIFNPDIWYISHMVTIDLNVERQLDEIFRKVEAGEVLRVMRGDREVMVIVRHDDAAEKAELDAWAALGMKAWAEISPVDEFADWKQPNGSR